MSGKRPLCTLDVWVPPKTEESETLETKLEVLKRFYDGHLCEDTARALGLPPTTVPPIHNNAGKIKAFAEGTTTAAAKLT